MKQITICEDCKYRSYNEGLTECSKCNGQLEILAKTKDKKVEKINLLAVVMAFGIVLLVSSIGSYTAPTYNSINFTLCSGYTAPLYNSINFTLSESDSCSEACWSYTPATKTLYVPSGCTYYIPSGTTGYG